MAGNKKKKVNVDDGQAKKIGFAPMKYRFGKWKFFLGWAKRHTLRALKLHNPEAEGFMVGASITDSSIALKVVRDDGDIEVVMNVGGAKHLCSELQKAISMVSFKG